MLASFRALSLGHRLIVVGGVVLFLIAVAAGLYFSVLNQGKASERAKSAQIDAQAVTEARSRDEAAHTTVAAATASTDAQNEAARKAADANPEDPLKAGLDALK